MNRGLGMERGMRGTVVHHLTTGPRPGSGGEGEGICLVFNQRGPLQPGKDLCVHGAQVRVCNEAWGVRQASQCSPREGKLTFVKGLLLLI